MSTYVISDIHGAYNRLMDLLDRVDFDYGKDTLYVLGDICDRLKNSGKVMEWAFKCPNSVKFCLGNHEDLMLGYFKEQDKMLRVNGSIDEDEKWELIYNCFYNSVWNWNGGGVTWSYMMELPEVWRRDILEWISRWPLYYDIVVNGRRFILVHAGLAMQGIRMSDDRYDKGIQEWVEIFDREMYSQSLLWIRDNWILDDSELPCDVVFGHTPSFRVCKMIEDFNDWCEIDGVDGIPIEKGKDILHFGKGMRKHCIDSGRECLAMLRLDDMEEFVSEVEE